MKNIGTKIIAFTFILVSLSLVSCGKFTRKGTIDRDCTGTYLQLNGKDYLICNPAMTDSYVSGSEVKAKFDSSPDCTAEQNPSGCELLHKKHGTIKITEIE